METQDKIFLLGHIYRTIAYILFILLIYCLSHNLLDNTLASLTVSDSLLIIFNVYIGISTIRGYFSHIFNDKVNLFDWYEGGNLILGLIFLGGFVWILFTIK